MEDRKKGAFYGCAVGDALGTSLEFMDRDVYPTVTEMLPARHHKFPAGYWTDDTSMMLCLSASYVATEGKHDGYNQLAHYYEWFSNGYLSVCDVCFDIGRTVLKALSHYKKTGSSIANTIHEFDQGNGSLMRIAPVPILHANNPDGAYIEGCHSSLPTHAHDTCVQACGLFAYLCAYAIRGASKHELLERLRSKHHSVPKSLQSITNTEFLTKTRNMILSTGYVVNTLEASLWAFFSTTTFEEGAILAVNLAGDADTVGAVYGTLAGAYYGYSNIPTRWLDALQGRSKLDNVYADLIKLTAT